MTPDHGERGGRRSVAHFQSGGSVGAGPGAVATPAAFVTRYRSRRLERFLTEEEFRRLGQELLDTLEAEGLRSRCTRRRLCGC